MRFKVSLTKVTALGIDFLSPMNLNINVKSTLEHVTQTVTMLPNASVSDKAKLQKRLTQLIELLAKVSQNKTTEAEYTAEPAQKPN